MVRNKIWFCIVSEGSCGWTTISTDTRPRELDKGRKCEFIQEENFAIISISLPNFKDNCFLPLDIFNLTLHR